MVDAFSQQGLRTGFYHSLIDWHHPHYVIDEKIGPYRNLPEEERAKMNQGRDQNKYADYLHAQVRELLTEYPQADILWFDFSFPPKDDPADHTKGKGHLAWRSEELYKLVRELRPSIILNDRLDMEHGWDVKTPEQYQPRQWVRHNGQPVVWEACQTFSGSWGYHRDESSWKSIGQLVRMLVDTVSKGGNLLLNVGPTGRGEFDARALDRLAGIGKWMSRHDRSIYGCTQAPDEFDAPRDCRLTYNPKTNRLYVHLFAWPFKHLFLDGKAFLERVEYAQFLHDASEVKLQRKSAGDNPAGHTQIEAGGDSVMLQLPVQQPVEPVTVIELFLK
jgi:alpha-L-fucosidase